MDDYLESTLMRGWSFLTGDVNFMDYGGIWYRQIGAATYHTIELINWEEVYGDRSPETYTVSLAEIDLATAPLDAALRCCGSEDCPDVSPEMALDAVQSYGATAPMGNWNGNNYRRLLANAKRESRRLTDDAAYHDAQLARPVNRIGSTALEYSQCDFKSAMIRGAATGDPNASLLLRIHGATPEDVAELAQHPELATFSLTA